MGKFLTLSNYGHTQLNPPHPVRSAKLNSWWQSQYYGGGPHGNTLCCNFCFYFFAFFFFFSVLLFPLFLWMWSSCPKEACVYRVSGHFYVLLRHPVRSTNDFYPDPIIATAFFISHTYQSSKVLQRGRPGRNSTEWNPDRFLGLSNPIMVPKKSSVRTRAFLFICWFVDVPCPCTSNDPQVSSVPDGENSLEENQSEKKKLVARH